MRGNESAVLQRGAPVEQELEHAHASPPRRCVAVGRIHSGETRFASCVACGVLRRRGCHSGRLSSDAWCSAAAMMGRPRRRIGTRATARLCQEGAFTRSRPYSSTRG